MRGDFIINIDHIINKKFNTDKGVLYLVELLQKQFPTLKMNLAVLPKLNIVEMPVEYYEQTGFVAEFVYERSEIKLLTNLEGSDRLNEDEILKSFLHELVHALTSKADENFIYEGLNIRNRETKQSSLFVGLNEGITQYIVNKVLGQQKDAYPYETTIATQLVSIIGEESLIESYSNNSYEQLQRNIKEKCRDYSDFDFRIFIESIYNISGYVFYGKDFGYNPSDFGQCLKNIQDITIKWYNSLEVSENGLFKFEDTILTQEKAVEIQGILLRASEYFGFEVLDGLEEIKGVRNGKK